MYCAGAHRSSECANKKTFQNHKCINCSKSNVTQLRFHAHDHVAGSRKCPMFLRELDKVKGRTCFDTKKLSRDVNKGLTFMSFNCRSVRNKTHEVMDFVIENEVDIAIFQETWLKKSNSVLIQI